MRPIRVRYEDSESEEYVVTAWVSDEDFRNKVEFNTILVEIDEQTLPILDSWLVMDVLNEESFDRAGRFDAIFINARNQFCLRGYDYSLWRTGDMGLPYYQELPVIEIETIDGSTIRASEFTLEKKFNRVFES